jgi:hypothetical protein
VSAVIGEAVAEWLSNSRMIGLAEMLLATTVSEMLEELVWDEVSPGPTTSFCVRFIDGIVVDAIEVVVTEVMLEEHTQAGDHEAHAVAEVARGRLVDLMCLTQLFHNIEESGTHECDSPPDPESPAERILDRLILSELITRIRAT